MGDLKIERSKEMVQLYDIENEANFDCVEITIDGEQIVLVTTDLILGYKNVAEIILEAMREKLTYEDVHDEYDDD